MEIPKPVISKVEETIFAYFDADAPKNGLSSSGYQQLFNRTKHVLEYLLRSNQDRLMQGLYRIVVQEE